MYIKDSHFKFTHTLGEGIPPYYYGTHYSTAMIVASYLIRMEPFTGHFIKIQVCLRQLCCVLLKKFRFSCPFSHVQGGYFDLPDRLFHSIPAAWVSSSFSSHTDVRELIPEFFYLPEFLKNTNHFNLG